VQLFHLRHEKMFAFDGAIDHLIETGGGARRLLRGSVAVTKLWVRRRCGLGKKGGSE